MGNGSSSRRRGWEVRAGLWLARHPGVTATPAAIAAGVAQVGVPATGGVLAGAAVGLAGWCRAHPDSFDRIAVPRLRALRRRWLSAYMGPRWRDVLLACDLVTAHRRTGELLVPRVLRVRAASPSVDTVWVRLLPGQSVRLFEAKAAELADALRAERVAVVRVKPQVVGLVVERCNPFAEVIPAPPMPYDSDAVDLGAVFLGEDEHGHDWTAPLTGNHLFMAGASGSGKSSPIWSTLRSVAPLIRDGSVRVWMVDPKRMELAPGQGIAHRYASEPAECLDLAEEFAEDMRTRQRELSAEGRRKVTVSPETPLNLLVLDELSPLLAWGDYARHWRKLLTEIGTQGRATGHVMLGAVQEPSKDTVPVRDLFTVRVCLRVTSAAHVDMTLGEGARLRGALADEIPNTPDTAGCGYVIRERTRTPLRVRAAYVSDAEVSELVDFVTTGRDHTGDPSGLRVVA